MPFLGGLEDQAEQEMHVGAVGSAFRRGPLSRGPYLTLAKRFSRVSGTRHKVSVFKVRERRGAIWLELAAIALAMAIRVWRSRVGSGTLKISQWFGSHS